MASPLFVSLRQSISDLRTDLIVERSDYTAYVRSDHSKALGFRVLASAHLESYVEERVKQVAEEGVGRLQRSQPTRTGCSLLIWYLTKGGKYPIPLTYAECVGHGGLEMALKAYKESIDRTHGVSPGNLKRSLMPLGLQDVDLDETLFDKMQSLADSRGQAAHLRVNRAKTMAEPIEEWKAVDGALPLLEALDVSLDRVLANP